MGRVIFFYQFGVIPAELVHGLKLDSLRTPSGTFDITSPIPAWMTIFTSMFIHGDWMHFAANMLYLWVFGDNIEDRFGHLKYLVFYLLAGVAAVWLQIAINTQSEIPTIGASGAIAGVLGAYLFLYSDQKVLTLISTWLFPYIPLPGGCFFPIFVPVWVPAWIFLLFHFLRDALWGQLAMELAKEMGYNTLDESPQSRVVLLSRLEKPLKLT